jgi:hypothetical protein
LRHDHTEFFRASSFPSSKEVVDACREQHGTISAPKTRSTITHPIDVTWWICSSLVLPELIVKPKPSWCYCFH